MKVRGFQVWLTASSEIACIAIVPFSFGAGVRAEQGAGLKKPKRVGIADLIICGFGLSIEWDIKEEPNDPSHTGVTGPDTR